MARTKAHLRSFNLRPGRVLAGKYAVEAYLGGGWEGEVYKVTERRTGLTRAAKLFYPHRNEQDRAVRHYARKLDRLKKCPIIIQYHHSETIRVKGMPVTCLISEFVEGQLLSRLVARQSQNRLTPFEALHLLYALTIGLEDVHAANEYHGDIHDGNVLVKRAGVLFDVKLVDLFHWRGSLGYNKREDLIQLVRVLYDAIGGRAWYATSPPEIKAICLGLRRDLIRCKFPTIRHLRKHLETFAWPSS